MGNESRQTQDEASREELVNIIAERIAEHYDKPMESCVGLAETIARAIESWQSRLRSAAEKLVKEMCAVKRFDTSFDVTVALVELAAVLRGGEVRADPKCSVCSALASANCHLCDYHCMLTTHMHGK